MGIRPGVRSNQKLKHMKRLPVLVIALLACGIACTNNKSEGGLSAAAQKNLDAMHGVTQCIESKDFSKIGDYIAADAVDHDAEKGDVKGLDSIKAELVRWAASVDNPKTEIIKELADDEYVMSWTRSTGTMKEASMGLKSGDKVDMKMIEVAKFKDGKAVEHWTMMEPSEMMKMMGGMPPMQAPADTVKK